MNKNFEEYKKVVQETIKGGKYAGRQFDNVYYAPKKKWGKKIIKGLTKYLQWSNEYYFQSKNFLQNTLYSLIN